MAGPLAALVELPYDHFRSPALGAGDPNPRPPEKADMSDASDDPGSYEQGDDAIDAETALDPDFEEMVELDPSLDPHLQLDERELEEAGAEFDDPEQIAVLEGLIDDPDGLGGPSTLHHARDADTEGWDLDAPIASEAEDDEDA